MEEQRFESLAAAYCGVYCDMCGGRLLLVWAARRYAGAGVGADCGLLRGSERKDLAYAHAANIARHCRAIHRTAYIAGRRPIHTGAQGRQTAQQDICQQVRARHMLLLVLSHARSDANVCAPARQPVVLSAHVSRRWSSVRKMGCKARGRRRIWRHKRAGVRLRSIEIGHGKLFV